MLIVYPSKTLAMPWDSQAHESSSPSVISFCPWKNKLQSKHFALHQGAPARGASVKLIDENGRVQKRVIDAGRYAFQYHRISAVEIADSDVQASCLCLNLREIWCITGDGEKNWVALWKAGTRGDSFDNMSCSHTDSVTNSHLSFFSSLYGREHLLLPIITNTWVRIIWHCPFSFPFLRDLPHGGAQLRSL